MFLITLQTNYLFCDNFKVSERALTIIFNIFDKKYRYQEIRLQKLSE